MHRNCVLLCVRDVCFSLSTVELIGSKSAMNMAEKFLIMEHLFLFIRKRPNQDTNFKLIKKYINLRSENNHQQSIQYNWWKFQEAGSMLTTVCMPLGKEKCKCQHLHVNVVQQNFVTSAQYVQTGSKENIFLGVIFLLCQKLMSQNIMVCAMVYTDVVTQQILLQ
jgi:hypothetical protein